MPLRLTYHADTTIPVEIEGLTPDWAFNKSLAEIEHFEVFQGNRKLPLAEFFTVSGDPSDLRFDLEGNLSGVHWIGARMTAGQIHVHGPAGRHVGSQMRGGQIQVSGNVSDWAGAEMHGGFLRVHGNAGHLVGGGYRGSPKGMTAGTIIINGAAGDEVGHTMRRGLIAIGGKAGDFLGVNLIAGTVLVFGECGSRPGAGMRRGTIGLFGPHPPKLLPTFRYATTCQPQIMALMLRQLQTKGLRFDDELLSSEFDLYHGDLVTVGKGEVLIRRVERNRMLA